MISLAFQPAILLRIFPSAASAFYSFLPGLFRAPAGQCHKFSTEAHTESPNSKTAFPAFLRQTPNPETLGYALDKQTLSLADGILSGQLSALSRGITLCESRRWDHQVQSAGLLQHLAAATSASLSQSRMFRVGITGPPGAGKSSLLERLGNLAIQGGNRVAVLAIDPSSDQTGGSILGDKTRMEELSKDPNAYVRPTPSRGHKGGVARNTADAAALCEAAGYNILMVETVGGGQADTAVADIVDLLMLVLPPAGGDQLQGIKKGVVEVADLLVVNKADGEMKDVAEEAVGEYRGALTYLRPRSQHWTPQVLSCSARTQEGVRAVWQKALEFREAMETAGELEVRRKGQRKRLMWSTIKEAFEDRLRADPDVQAKVLKLEQQVLLGTLNPRLAAIDIARSFFDTRRAI